MATAAQGLVGWAMPTFSVPARITADGIAKFTGYSVSSTISTGIPRANGRGNGRIRLGIDADRRRAGVDARRVKRVLQGKTAIDHVGEDLKNCREDRSPAGCADGECRAAVPLHDERTHVGERSYAAA